jgi:hypothetical protein
MFKKENTDEAPAAETSKKPPKNPMDETAYEDSWYRSLKAMAERTDGDDEEVGAPTD